jgi:NAD+ diphosphatase
MKPTLGTAASLDRQSHRRADAQYLAELAGRTDARFMLLVDLKPVLELASPSSATTSGLRWYSAAQVNAMGLPLGEVLFLGVEPASGAGRFALLLTDHRARAVVGAPRLLRPLGDVRQLASEGALSNEELSLAGLAKALGHWHDNARCCGHCGGTTLVRDGGWKRRCWACGREHFPRTDPVVIMLIVDPTRERCLLGRAPRFAERMFSTLAGFVEPGEDIEHAVRRETLEETGVEVGPVSFHSAQPWPFPHSLMIGCIGMATTTEVRIDPAELVEARWFSRDEANQLLEGNHPDGLFGPGQQAIARTLIGSFVDRSGVP